MWQAKVDARIDGFELKVKLRQARGEVDGDARVCAENCGNRGASQRVPNVGSMAKFRLPPCGLVRKPKVALEMRISAPRISWA